MAKELEKVIQIRNARDKELRAEVGQALEGLSGEKRAQLLRDMLLAGAVMKNNGSISGYLKMNGKRDA